MNRKIKQERKQRLRELNQPDRCVCDRSSDADDIYRTAPSDAEWVKNERRSGEPYTEFTYVNTWQCRKCGKLFDDSLAMA